MMRNGLADSFPAALLAALFLQAGATAVLAGAWWNGCLLASLGLTILTGRLTAAGILTKSRLNRLATAILIVALCTELITLYFRSLRGGYATAGAPERATGLGSGKYRGVILWTPAKPPAVLIAPLPPSEFGLKQSQRSLVIPFDGVYWFFKFPDRKPPPDSYSARGTPSATAFRSADSQPLQMEARQNFPAPFDMSCCSRIAVEIVNADPASGTVSLELILANLRLPGEPSQSLGRLPVTSTPQPSASEVLSFVVPASPKIRQFDSATVRFIRERGRNLSSAKIAIRQFMLIPR